MDTRKKIYLVDGTSIIYKAFYAITSLTNSKGMPTNSVYGFIRMMGKLVADEQPEYICFLYDTAAPTFRKEIYDAYKANREAIPDGLIPQIPYIKKVVEMSGFAGMELDGYEADDLIGTLARQAALREYDVVIVANDKDLLQLVDENTVMLKPLREGYERVDVEGVREKYGIDPGQFVEMQGLMGDSTDNIPGVPGVGEKTAISLIKEYGSIAGVLENIENISGKKRQENLREFSEQARLSKELATIKTDVPLEFDPSFFRRKEADTGKLKELYRELEFFTLLKDLEGESSEEPVEIKTGADEVTGLAEKIKSAAESAGIYISFRKEKDRNQAAEAVGLANEKETVYLESVISDKELREEIKGLLSKSKAKIVLYDSKQAFLYIKDLPEGEFPDFEDVKIKAYCLESSLQNYGLDILIARYTGQTVPSKTDVGPLSGWYAGRLLELDKELSERLSQTGLEKIYKEIEIPLVPVLTAMERIGIKIDTAHFLKLKKEFEKKLSLLEQDIYDLAGEVFNINSPKQLGGILFEKLGLPAVKKTKTGYSTNNDVLSQLAAEHVLPEKIIEYRSFSKLLSTYITPLPSMISDDKRIHTIYNQTGTVTGRLSSSDPNLQNIPIRTEWGREIRRGFIPEKGYKFLNADYSQIELRVLAHLSEDKMLLKAFREDRDVHAATAAEVFGIMPEMVTKDMRRVAKIVNFGIIYGLSAFGLSRDLKISRSEADKYIKTYFERYGGVRRYLDESLEKAREHGYVTTLTGRKRVIADINSKNRVVRQSAERMAINTPVQGSAADMIKLAMIRIHEKLKADRMKSRMILQVHDELLFEVPPEEESRLAEMVRREMEDVLELKVPVKVDIGIGETWGH